MCGQSRLAAGASCQVFFQSLNSFLVTVLSACPVACNPCPTQTPASPRCGLSFHLDCASLSPAPWSDSHDTIQRRQVQAACKLTAVFNLLSLVDQTLCTPPCHGLCSATIGVICSTSEDSTRWCPLCKPLMFSPGFCHPALTYCCSLLTAPRHGAAGQLLHFPGATYGGSSRLPVPRFPSSTCSAALVLRAHPLFYPR